MNRLKTASNFQTHWAWWAGSVLLLSIAAVTFSVLQQRSTLHWLDAKGGRYYAEPGLLSSQLPTPATKWMKKTIGNHWSDPIDTVVNITLVDIKLTDDVLTRLHRFQKLESLHLRKSQLSEPIMEQIADFPQLRRLGLGESNVDDSWLKYLVSLPKLESLTLNHTQIGDHGLVHLSGCGELRELILLETSVTDAGLIHLKHCSKLVALNLEGTQVTDAGITHLKELKNLEKIFIRGTEVSGAGRKVLQTAIPGLQILPPLRTKPEAKPESFFPSDWEFQ